MATPEAHDKWSLANELCPSDDDVARAKLMETMEREVRRKKGVFTKLTKTPDGIQRIALVSNRSEVA